MKQLINNVVCVKKQQIKYSVTIGKVYNVFKVNKQYFYIINDAGKNQRVNLKSSNFKIEQQTIKIPKIIKVQETYFIIPSKMNYGK